MEITLSKIRGDDFWDYQAEVIPEEDIIAKIHRSVELRTRPSAFDFDHISEEDNRKLDMYELIQFFKAEKHQTIAILVYPTPTPQGVIGETIGEKTPKFEIHFSKVGQAQLWYSKTTKKCILWECYLFGDKSVQRIKQVWEWLLQYIKTNLEMREIYTHDFDPAYRDIEYDKFLTSLDFKTTEKPNVMLRTT